MGKIILEFDSFEEKTDARLALDATKWYSVVWDLDQKFRGCAKYGASLKGHGSATEEEMDFADKARDIIREVMHDNGVDFDL